MNPTDLKLLTIDQAAEIIGVDLKTLLLWNDQNILKPTITTEGKIGYTQEQVNQFLAIKQKAQESSSQYIQTSHNISSQSQITNSEFSPTHPTWHIENSWTENVLKIKSQGSYPTPKLTLSLAFMILAAAIGIFSLTGGVKDLVGQSEQELQQEIGIDPSSTLETSKMTVSQVSPPHSQVRLASYNLSDKNLNADSGPKQLNPLNLITSATRIATNSSSQIGAPVVALAKTYADFFGNKDVKNVGREVAGLKTFASQSLGSENQNLAFDEKGNIKGTLKDTLAMTLGGVGASAFGADSSKLVSTDITSQILFFTTGILVFIFMFGKRLPYAFKTVNKASLVDDKKVSEKIIEVSQKTDGTIFLNFEGHEYKISKPELYSESDQFIERLMQAANGTKEIEFELSSDEKIDVTTPLSRLVTRLGFVGMKRELFFPRTSKDRVLFRRYLTQRDLKDMNLTTEEILRDFTQTI